MLGGVGPAGAEPNILATQADHVLAYAADHLWRSTDGGASFTEVQATFDGGGGDADIAADAAGDVFFVGLLGKQNVPFQVSHDDGLTWSAPVDLSPDHGDVDRQWVDALPNGSVFVTWWDQTQGDDYLLFRRSLDAGATWSGAMVLADGTIAGPLVHDPSTGDLYTVLYDDGIQVARSDDQGTTWTLLTAWQDDRPLWEGYSRNTDMFPVIAVDAAGAIYVAWAMDAAGLAKDAAVPQLFLSVSTDRGASWTKPASISPPDKASIFPWISAGGPGRVVVTWYENQHGAPNEYAPDLWDVAVAESVDASRSAATWIESHANRAPVHTGSLCSNGGGCERLCQDGVPCITTRDCNPTFCVGRDRSRADFFENAIRPNGQPVLVWVGDGDTGPLSTGVNIYAGGATSGSPLT